MRAVHPAVFDEDIPNVSGYLASDRDAAVPILHGAVADDQVLAGHAHAAPVAIAAGLDGDAIVARIEQAAFDQHVGATFRIAAIVVRTVARDLDVAHGDVAA